LRFASKDNEYVARNPGQGFEAHFGASGVQVTPTGASADAAGAPTSLRFSAWGREGSMRELPTPMPQLGPCTDPQRVDEQGECSESVRRTFDGVVEVWDNLEAGLEQTFTIAHKVAGEGRLALAIDVAGASPEAQGVDV